MADLRSGAERTYSALERHLGVVAKEDDVPASERPTPDSAIEGRRRRPSRVRMAALGVVSKTNPLIPGVAGFLGGRELTGAIYGATEARQHHLPLSDASFNDTSVFDNNFLDAAAGMSVIVAGVVTGLRARDWLASSQQHLLAHRFVDARQKVEDLEPSFRGEIELFGNTQGLDLSGTVGEIGRELCKEAVAQRPAVERAINGLDPQPPSLGITG
jgi:hypothetical protein